MGSTDLVSSRADTIAALGALADPVRLAVVSALAEGEQCVCDLREQVPVAENLLSYHLRVLREAGLVASARRGRWVDYRLDGEGFSSLWASLATAGVPLPGEPVATGRARPACEDGRPA
jgi:ArsR family transcriptional regulator